jgi:kinesin family protein 20
MAPKPATTHRVSTRTQAAATAEPPATRTTRARAATTKATVLEAPLAPTQTVRKTALRKPLLNRENSVDVAPPTKAAPKSAATRKLMRQPTALQGVDREPIMVCQWYQWMNVVSEILQAYLRIRPHLGDDPISLPYLTPLSETSVRMTDPHDPQNNFSRFRPSAVPPSIYTFSHVFPPSISQSDFFTKTTLPLVQDALQGQSGLLFTYGVTNSGKTYTVQGGLREGSAGILPRSLDVLFNSIDGLHGDGKVDNLNCDITCPDHSIQFRPVRLHGIEPADAKDSKPPQIVPEPALAKVLGQHLDITAPDSDVDPTVLKVDRNYEYTIWISYAEVYNEKVYDLLTSVKEDSSIDPDPRTANDKALVLARAALPLRPSPPSDNADSATSGKYIAGLRQFRVHSAAQAKALVKLGQLHRRVFGTLANRESSRSHGMFIIKIVRGHRGERGVSLGMVILALTVF